MIHDTTIATKIYYIYSNRWYLVGKETLKSLYEFRHHCSLLTPLAVYTASQTSFTLTTASSITVSNTTVSTVGQNCNM